MAGALGPGAAARRGVGLLVWTSMLTAVPALASAQAANFVQVGSIPGPADIVQLHGDRAYTASGKTLTLHDLSNPAAPSRLGSYSFPEKIWGFRVVGSLVYVAADFFGLGILDVSNAAAPALRGSIKTPGQAKAVAVFGAKAVVADHMSGVDYIDVSNHDKPANLGSFFLDGYARDVAASGSIAIAVDAPTGLYVFDLSREGPLDAVTVQQSATAPGSIVVSSPAESGSPTLAVLIGAGSLQVYDVSDPLAPVRASTHKTGGRPLRVALVGAVAYVADGPAGLQVLDLSMPSKPKPVATFQTPKPARAVAVAGSLVLVVVGELRQDPTTREFVDHGTVLILRRSP